jgi:hypothetical protein
MSAFVSGDRVRWNGETFVVSSVFNTNTEGWRANLYTEEGLRCTAPAQECELIDND